MTDFVRLRRYTCTRCCDTCEGPDDDGFSPKDWARITLMPVSSDQPTSTYLVCESCRKDVARTLREPPPRSADHQVVVNGEETCRRVFSRTGP